MNYESIKNEFIKLKREELEYINEVSIISSKKELSEDEKIEIYRNLKHYVNKLNELLKKLQSEMIESKHLTKENLKETIIEFDLNKDFLNSIDFFDEVFDGLYRKWVLKILGIDSETLKFKLTLSDLIRYRKHSEYKGIDFDIIQNNQKLIEKPIYIFCGYYDSSEDNYGPYFGELDDYLYGIYKNIRDVYDDEKEMLKKEMNDFEKDNIIIRSTEYVDFFEIQKIFNEELLNLQNKTIEDCVIQTKRRIQELSYTRSPEYKEKLLLERINELYKKVKGEFIQKEILYSGKFLEVLKETYKLPNGNTVEKEKIVKNKRKNSVIIVATTQNKEYIITFQNRMKDKMIAEFPAGYIETGEEPLQAAKRELKEETGYVSDDLFIVDQAYTSPGTDNSTTYIVMANNCIKTAEKNVSSTEFINYGLFSEKELEYLINKNIMNGAMNKLAYYNLVNNVDDCDVTYDKKDKKYIKHY